MSELVYITEATVKTLLNWDDLYEAIESALKSVSSGQICQNPRTTTKISENGVLLTMPGLLKHPKYGAAACKLVTYCPDNTPAILANITLFDEMTGQLKAVIAANEITKWRTACASAVATRHLTSGKQLKVLGVLGAGHQGHSHAVIFQHFFHFEQVLIWNRNPDKARRLADELNCGGGNIFKAIDSREDCVRRSDVVVTATSASEPLVELEWLKSGAHLNAVGGSSHYGELTNAIYRSAKVYVDQESSAVEEAGDLLKSGVVFSGEIGQVINGQVSLPPANQITVFLSLGLAVEDCAAARLIHDAYSRKQTNK